MSNNIWNPQDQSNYEIIGAEEMTPLDFVQTLLTRHWNSTLKVLFNGKQVAQNHSFDFIHQMIKRYINNNFTQEDTMDLMINEVLYDEMEETDGYYWNEDDEEKSYIFFCADTNLIVFAKDVEYPVVNHIRCSTSEKDKNEKTGLTFKKIIEWKKQK